MTEDTPPYGAQLDDAAKIATSIVPLDELPEMPEPLVQHHVVLDIETAPYPPELCRALGFAEPPRSYRAQNPQTHLDSDEAYWQRWHDETAQLDPGRSHICAIGIYLIGGGMRIAFADTREAEGNALAAAEAILRGEIPIENPVGAEVRLDPDRTAIVGHNLLGYDLPYLRAREAITGQSMRIAVADIVDTKREWDRNYLIKGGGSSSLDHIAATLGWPTKPGSGKDFWTWGREKQKGYLAHDLRTTGMLAVRLGLVPDPEPEAGEMPEELPEAIAATANPEPIAQ